MLSLNINYVCICSLNECSRAICCWVTVFFLFLWRRLFLLSCITSLLEFSLLPLLPDSPPTPLSPTSTAPLFHFKNISSRPPIDILDIHWTGPNKTEHKPFYHCWRQQPSMRKMFQVQAKENTKNTKIHIHKLYAEHLAQTHTGSVFVASVSVSPYVWVVLSWFYGKMVSWCPKQLWLLQYFLCLFCGISLALPSVGSWVSVSAPIGCQINEYWVLPSNEVWVKTSISELIRISLGNIS